MAEQLHQQPDPAHEMREWLGHTADRVRAAGARRFVDVGVGVGLYLRALAPAPSPIWASTCPRPRWTAPRPRFARHGSAARPSDLRQGDATLLAELARVQRRLGAVQLGDAVLSGPDYLRRALTEALRVAGPPGAVFVGDVRDLCLLPAFHADTQLRRAPSLLPAREVGAPRHARWPRSGNCA